MDASAAMRRPAFTGIVGMDGIDGFDGMDGMRPAASCARAFMRLAPPTKRRAPELHIVASMPGRRSIADSARSARAAARRGWRRQKPRIGTRRPTIGSLATSAACAGYR
jgi:hypothetical protein